MPALWFYEKNIVLQQYLVLMFFCSTGLPIAFIVFLVYEKKEQEIDSVMLGFKSFACKRKNEVSEKLFGSKKYD